MIKFFCLNCGQKLAVDDEGIGVVVSCTNCQERIVVPPHNVTESFFAKPAQRRGAPPIELELIQPDNERAANVPAPAHTALIPHLARLMMNRLVQALFAQRTSLLNTQGEATKRMAELEERLAKAQANVQKKMVAYETRIAELEGQLAAKEEECHDLMRENFQLAKKALETENSALPRRVSLRDAGFLLRA